MDLGFKLMVSIRNLKISSISKSCDMSVLIRNSSNIRNIVIFKSGLIVYLIFLFLGANADQKCTIADET